MKIIGGITVVTILSYLGSVWYGYVISLLWAWFMVPTFGLPRLRIPVALAIAAIFKFLGPDKESSKSVDDKTLRQVMVESIVKAGAGPLILLIYGWILTFWM